MRIGRGLVQEEIVHHDAFHRRQRGGDVMRVGIGLRDVFALDVKAHEGAFDGGIEHVGDTASPGSGSRVTPQSFSI